MLSGTFFGSANILKSYDRIKIIMLFLRLTVVERRDLPVGRLISTQGVDVSCQSDLLLNYDIWTGLDWTGVCPSPKVYSLPGFSQARHSPVKFVKLIIGARLDC